LQKINCDKKAQEIFQELCKEIHSTKNVIGKLYYFFELVADNMFKTENYHTNPVIEKAIDCINNNPGFKISEIAKYCNISEPGIYSIFKRCLNKTPNEIKNKILCEKAVSLLITTNKSVQEISDTLNFSSTSYFRKILKEHTGKRPLEIRKEADF
jgi:AraC-like DNA-binding protein